MRTSSNTTILIVDNDDELTRALARRLASHGFCCVAAGSGAQGLAAFRESPADVIVSDLNMPGGDGVAFAEAIRRISDVPIIFITGFRDDFKRRLRAISNVTTLRKPFDSQTLIDVIATACAARGETELMTDASQENL
jgi:two-component system cell cycle sensor histidine kinase/response regulator CckA